MNTSTLILLGCLLLLASAKPIYDFKTSYITQLTDFNFRDQVTKIRQNTNSVSVVHFYKYDGKCVLIQMDSLSSSGKSSTNGPISTVVSSR